MSIMLRAAHLARFAGASRFAAPQFAVRSFSSYPSDRKYSKSHEWALLQDGVATVGITKHAQESLGDIVFAEVPDIGKEIEAKERAATIESVKAAADVYTPITGEVVAVNDSLVDDPSMLNQENAHGDAWIFKIKVSDETQLDSMLSSEDYAKMIEE